MTYRFPISPVEFTKDREQAHVFPSYDQAMEWALAHKGSNGLGHGWRIAAGWDINAPAIIEYYANPTFVQYVASLDIPEPDNSDEEPDQLAPGD